MKRYRHVSLAAAILACTGYLIFTGLAYLRYPMPYSPINNWLSDLGNPDLNPQGATYYNIGIIITGLFLMGFFEGLSAWKIFDRRTQVIMLWLTQAFGLIGAFSMIMSGIFPINLYEIHSFWSTSLYVLLSTSFVFSAAMLRYHQEVHRWLLFLGISTAGMVVLTGFFQTIYVLEWITVFLFLSYTFLLGIETQRKYGRPKSVRQ
jgi:hypothetical membrane protein